MRDEHIGQHRHKIKHRGESEGRVGPPALQGEHPQQTGDGQAGERETDERHQSKVPPPIREFRP